MPTELYRSILVEAGHRCAIHTCLHPAHDVHHIVPWEKCRKHEHPNLIALCPNCHRRADRGEIDAESLRQYKAALRQITAFRSPSSVPDGTAVQAAWATNRITEKVTNGSESCEITLEFPSLLPDLGEFKEFNDLQRATALQRLHEARALRLETQPYSWEGPGDSIVTTCQVLYCTSEVISVRYEDYTYGAGAAHGNTTSRVVNYRRDPLTVMELRSLFIDEDAGVRVLSEHCVWCLEAENGDTEPNALVREGAGIASDALRKFNVTPHGLVITFDPYVVGPYSEGTRRVDVPRTLLAGVLRADASPGWLWQQ